MVGFRKKRVEEEFDAQAKAMVAASVALGIQLEVGASAPDRGREHRPLLDARAERLKDKWLLGYSFGYALYWSNSLRPNDLEGRSALTWFFFKQLLGEAKGEYFYDLALVVAKQVPRDENFRSGALAGATEAEQFAKQKSLPVVLMERIAQLTSRSGTRR